MVCSTRLVYWFTLTATVIHRSSSFRLEFDDYDSIQVTKYPCFGIGTRCDMTPECCPPATCALPAWSPRPVCLVSGYKQLLGDLKANSPARVRDILHIKHMFNISYFDHLLIEVSTQPTSKEVDVVPSINVNSKNVFEYNLTINKSNIYSLTNNVRKEFSNGTTNSSDLQDSIMAIPPGSPDDLNTAIELNSTLQQLRDHLKTQVKFLIIKSSIESLNSTSNNTDKFNNTDQFKTVVKLLEEKLRMLNQNESMPEKELYISESSKIIDIQPTTPKESKWNLVKAYFFKKSENDVDNSVLEIQSPPTMVTTGNYENSSSDDKYENGNFQDPLIDNIDSDERIKEAFRKLYSPKNIDELLINNYDDIDKGIEIEIDNGTGSGISNEDIVEVYNIDIPPNIEQENDKEASIDKVDTEKVFSTITKTLGSLHLNEQDQGILQNTGNEETLSHNQGLERTTDASQKPCKETHFWKKEYLWPVNGNLSEKITKELKNLFVWKKSSKVLHKIKPTLVLDEHFLLNLNYKNQSNNISDSSSVQSDKTASDYSIGYSTSVESSSSEDLYNSSYVFVVRKNNSSEKVKGGRWKTLLNIFHISKMLHSSKNFKSLNNSNNSSAPNREDLNNTVIQKVIRLPEYLMPDALKEREVNETDYWAIEDSKDIEENTFVEQRSSNGTFLFFFKW